MDSLSSNLYLGLHDVNETHRTVFGELDPESKGKTRTKYSDNVRDYSVIYISCITSRNPESLSIDDDDHHYES